MSEEGTYEDACMRAELLGLDKPDQVEFEKLRAKRLEKEQEQLDAAEAAVLETQEEALRNAGGKLDELNSILSSTQLKLKRFKQTACGSITNMFGRNSLDMPESSSRTGSISDNSGLGAALPPAPDSAADNDVSAAIDDLKELKLQDVEPVIPTEKIRAAKMDIQKKMSSHLDKLDALIGKAENAEISMTEQTKEMRRLAK